MSDKTSIEWTDATWNPVQGCDKISPGCKHCYAETLAERYRSARGYEHGFDLTLYPHRLDQPRRWRKPRRVFVCSMSDLFHDAVPYDYLTRVWQVMRDCPQHTFQVLTKRSRRMRRVLPLLPHLPNVWHGVSVDTRHHGIEQERVRDLQAVHSAVRFLSCEPLLEDLGPLDLTGIHWVIAGCESLGPGLGRPAELDWFRNIRDQCVAAGVPFFLKQAGLPNDKGHPRLVKRPMLDGRVWAEMPRAWEERQQ